MVTVVLLLYLCVTKSQISLGYALINPNYHIIDIGLIFKFQKYVRKRGKM